MLEILTHYLGAQPLYTGGSSGTKRVLTRIYCPDMKNRCLEYKRVLGRRTFQNYVMVYVRTYLWKSIRIRQKKMKYFFQLLFFLKTCEKLT